ncbi:ABC transporter permease [Spiroplasma culicicola]|nr:ABC transporter permease [Spiroplasma culicicola]
MSRIENSYNDFISEQYSNQHDFVIDLSNTSYKNNYNEDKFKTITDVDVRDNLVMSYLQDKLKDSEYEFNIDRVESRLSTLSSEKTLKVFALNPDQKVDKFAVSKGMQIDLWKKYTQATNNYTVRWAYVNEQFAKQNNIQINDIIRIQDDEYGSTVLVKDSEKKSVDMSIYDGIDINLWIDRTEYSNQNWFQVVGYGSTADFSTPIVDATKPLPDTKNEGLVYVNPISFGLQNVYYNSIYPDNEFDFNNTDSRRIWYTDSELKTNEVLKVTSASDKEINFVGKFINNTNINEKIEVLNKYLTSLDNQGHGINLYTSYENKVNKNLPIVTGLGDSNYNYANRTTMLHLTIVMYKTFSFAVMGVTLSIAIVMLITMLNNQIKKTFGQSGVLMSLGYKKSSLIWSNSLYPLFISVTGGLIGYIVGMSSQDLIINIFNNYFAINMQPFSLSWQSLLVTLLGIFTLLETITLITYFYTFSKFTPLEMINFESRSATNKFKLGLKKILTTRKKFDSRFKGAILSNSIAKLMAVFSVMFVSSTLISIGTIMPQVLSDNKVKTYEQNSFDNIIEYQSPIYNSPTSFYKTYNPSTSLKDFDIDNSENILDMYIQNNINQKVYNPSTDVGALNDMTYKTIDLDYLKNLDLTIELPSGTSLEQKNTFYKTVILNLWSDLKNFSIDKYWNKEDLKEILFSDTKSKEHINDLEKLRQFYIKYRYTLGLEKDQRRDGYFTRTKTSIVQTEGPEEDGGPLISNEEFKEGTGLRLTKVDLKEDGSILNDQTFDRSLYEFVNTDEWTTRRLDTITPIYNWIIAFFYNNIQQAFLQGIYSELPSMIRDIVKEEYGKENGNYNITFGVVPYDNSQEDIGIYLNGYVGNESIKIYGIKEDNKTFNLFDEKHQVLEEKLFKTKNSIIINQSFAKRLNLKVGDKISINHIIEALNYQQEEVSLDSWDTSKIDATNTQGNTNSSNIYSHTMFDSTQSGWTNSLIGDQDSGLVYKSNVDLTSESMVGPTSMVENVATGNVAIANYSSLFEYQVVGIADQYGNNQAWINNDLAKTISKYEQTETKLFEVFMKEWSNPANAGENVTKLKQFINSVDSNNAFEEFKKFTQIEGNEIYWTLFENEYPLFNYKTSLDNSLTDVTKGSATTQSYGDYSMFGLNGGKAGNNTYTGNSVASISNLVKIDEAIKVMNRINETIDALIYFVIAVAIVLSIIIILLTINLVIFENSKIIAVMKILGYKPSYISKLFIGIYVPVAIFSSFVGFGFSWLIVLLTIKSMTATIVLPLIFQVWYIIPGILGTWLIYAISTAISWGSLKRVSMLLAVQGG